MNKPIILTSIAVTLLIYSIGLMIYGPFGSNYTKQLEAQKEALQSVLQSIELEHAELVIERDRLNDDEYVSALAKEYGVVSGGESIIYFTDDTDAHDLNKTETYSVEIQQYRQISNTILLLIAAAGGLVFFVFATFFRIRSTRKK